MLKDIFLWFWSNGGFFTIRGTTIASHKSYWNISTSLQLCRRTYKEQMNLLALVGGVSILVQNVINILNPPGAFAETH